jgi:hypothetical protein
MGRNPVSPLEMGSRERGRVSTIPIGRKIADIAEIETKLTADGHG